MIIFHRFLISTAILFCAGYCGYAVAEYRRSGSIGQLLLGIAFALAAVLLGYYLKNLKRFLYR